MRFLSTARLQSIFAWAVSLLLVVTLTFSQLPQPHWLAESQVSSESQSASESAASETQTRSNDQSTAADRLTGSSESASEDQAQIDSQQEAGPYDMEAIKAFNRALYGS